MQGLEVEFAIVGREVGKNGTSSRRCQLEEDCDFLPVKSCLETVATLRSFEEVIKKMTSAPRMEISFFDSANQETCEVLERILPFETRLCSGELARGADLLSLLSDNVDYQTAYIKHGRVIQDLGRHEEELLRHESALASLGNPLLYVWQRDFIVRVAWAP